MHGNVSEFCLDKNDWAYYPVSPEFDPPGSSSSTVAGHIVRGGGWNTPVAQLRSGWRAGTGGSNNEMGFRVVCPAVAK